MSNPLLITGAALSAAAAILHTACIFFGASWYRALGAGELMARLAAAGSWRPALITSVIVLVLAGWSLYALSGAGVIPGLPLVRAVLCLIAGIYLLRAVVGFALAAFAPGNYGPVFWWWSSAVCLAIGAVHLVGTWQVWSQLTQAMA